MCQNRLIIMKLNNGYAEVILLFSPLIYSFEIFLNKRSFKRFWSEKSQCWF